MTDSGGEVILGVDTHELEHVAAVLDSRGRLLATGAFPANRSGFLGLLAWARSHGDVDQAGVEGTGSFGVSLTRFLLEQGVDVVEVTRPNRRGRRHLGKSDPLDAEAAARAVLSGEATAVPKSATASSSRSAYSTSPAEARSRPAHRRASRSEA